jgi:hypothetical protein
VIKKQAADWLMHAAGLDRVTENAAYKSGRHCEPTGRREAPPDDKLSEAIQCCCYGPGLFRFARNDES